MVREITGRKKKRKASKAKAAKAAKERTSKPKAKAKKAKNAKKGGGKAGKARRQREKAQRKDIQGTLPGLDIWRMWWGWKILMGVFTGEDVSDLRLSTPLLMQLIKTSLYLLQAKRRILIVRSICKFSFFGAKLAIVIPFMGGFLG